MPFSSSSSLSGRHVTILGLWLVVGFFLASLTVACLFGQVEHELEPHQIGGGQVAVARSLPTPPRYWPGEFHLEILEGGHPLGPEVEDPQAVRETGGGTYATVVGGGLGSPRITTLYFSASDGSSPPLNGREYVVRYRRRQLPASMALLLACWILLPTALIRWWRRRKRSVGGIGARLDATAWSVAIAGGLYSLFAIQAWIPAPNALWLLAVGAAGFAPLLASLFTGQWAPPGWLPWVVGLLVWAGGSSLAGSSYASPASAIAFLVTSAWGLVFYFGLRGSLLGRGRRGTSLLLGLFIFTVGLSLARDAGFDPAGRLASLGLTSLSWEGVVNPWTTKFMAHWLLVVAWCALAALGWGQAETRRSFALVSILGVVAIGLNGSTSAMMALALAAAVAISALRWPRILRRLLVAGLVVGVLVAPLLAAVPWKIQSVVGSHLPGEPQNERTVHPRSGIWEFSRRFIALRPLEGWGFGGSGNLPGRELPIWDALGLDPDADGAKLPRSPALAGGHPHNAALLTWLDLGLVGALLLAGLLIAAGKAIARVEERKGTHAALLGLLTTTAAYLTFNYPAWEPEVMSILWMSVVLPSAVLQAPAVSRREHLRNGAAVLLILALGCGALVQGRLSRWLTVRDLRGHETTLDLEAGRLVAGGEAWDLEVGGELVAGAELLMPGPGAPAVLRGWAFDPSSPRAPEAVLVFVGSRLVGVTWPERPSPEAFAAVKGKTVRALTAGFLVRVEPERGDLDAPVTIVFLRRGRALARELPPLSGDSSGGNSHR